MINTVLLQKDSFNQASFVCQFFSSEHLGASLHIKFISFATEHFYHLGGPRSNNSKEGRISGEKKRFSIEKDSLSGDRDGLSCEKEWFSGEKELLSCEKSEDDAFPNGRILDNPNLKTYTYAELKTATKNFKPDTILGEGGFGRVFKGWVDEKTLAPAKSGLGMIVAVKKLNSESMQGLKEWQCEVNHLGRLSHPNLVKLLGYCWEEKELLLVYEFMPKGSLENHLFRRGSSNEPLTWSLRLKIAIGAAKGLTFLHNLEKHIIYRDFKAANILLDSNYNAKISDFGLAKFGPLGDDSHVTTRVMGTHGYAAPEYVATGHLYVKSDVYTFGVVLLEILTGLRALDLNRPTSQINLVDWAKPLLGDRRKLEVLMDIRLDNQYPIKGALETCKLSLKCLTPEPRKRPHMKEVLEELQRIAAIKEKPKESKRADKARSAAHPQTYMGHRSPINPRLDGFPLNGQHHAR
ncbi:probable serine/threonine-protein kinase PIX13 isoform X1 [Amborella trichopoda]|uniref:probable serine/threonine-protein kinase PIX13 isoform X1 n=2 Tax=Amborella trichopoda TaxID=13333 RepID=UPI0009BD99F7|nr:probable serine/threonine-protein kinase PIX13 isoform X1 [Amborella trichopoda]|eukprot:XP_020529962.1 probable serine/threonine-protein kinase PIX13 isoform X1 [Amborella trichopoda]